MSIASGILNAIFIAYYYFKCYYVYEFKGSKFSKLKKNSRQNRDKTVRKDITTTNEEIEMMREKRQVTPEDIKKLNARPGRAEDLTSVRLFSSDSEISEVAFNPKKVDLIHPQDMEFKCRTLFFGAIQDSKREHSWYHDAIDPAPKAEQADVSWYHIAVDPGK